MKCKWCHGTGREYVEAGGSLYYRCPDCDGTGIAKPLDEEEDDTAPDCGDTITDAQEEKIREQFPECFSLRD